VGHVSRSSGLLRVEVSLTMIFQSSLKTAGGAMMSGTRDIITEVMSS
jgi:hypothetical protein